MRPLSSVIRLGLVSAGLAALGACDQPKPRQPPPAPAAAAVPPVAAVPVGEPLPLPAMPAWAGEYTGKPLRTVLPNDGACIGNTDIVETRYAGEPKGVKIVGWGWDPGKKAAVARVLLVNADQLVVAVGETGVERPDVVAAKPEVTSPTTGWAAYAPITSGALDAYGVVGDGKAACRLGHIQI